MKAIKIYNAKLEVEFERSKSVLRPCYAGGSVQYFKGHHMIYDNHNMCIGNIKHRRYNFLKDNFCSYYNISNVEFNKTTEKLWHDDLTRLIQKYPYKHKHLDTLNKTSLPHNIIESICIAYNIDTLQHFTPFNVLMNDNFTYISKSNHMFGSIESNFTHAVFMNTIYSVSNIKKQLKYIQDNYNETTPFKICVCIPLLPNVNIYDCVSKDNIITILPPRSYHLQCSDHWYDIEYNNLLNVYPIALCIFSNEIARTMSPVSMENIEKLEAYMNKNLLHNKQHQLILNRSSYQSFDNSEISTSLVPQYETVYTDASIRFVNNTSFSSIGVWFGPKNNKNISQRISSSSDLANDINFCELVAIYVAILNADRNTNVNIYTDSYTSLKFIYEGYNNNTQIKNKKYQPIVKKILSLIQQRKYKTKLLKVKAHNGDVGNYNADLMAKLGIFNENDSAIDINQIDYRYNNVINNLFNNIKYMIPYK